MRYLITGHAGFIGFSLAKSILENKKNFVVGIDNFNKYYDVKLKKQRIKILKKINNKKNLKSYNCDLRDEKKLKRIFSSYKFDIVVNLAAQAGIRYSLENPKEYVTSNINGFFNLIDLAKKNKVKKFIYASSSIVYGNSSKIFFSETDNTNKPLQIYAATKISNEMIAHSYSHLYNLNTIGLRFFTVYGPWGRPDMAIFKFTKNIFENKTINLFNSGKNLRDFTYIDDVILCIKNICLSKKFLKKKFQILNIGNSKPVQTLKMLNILEKILKKKAKKKLSKKFKADSFKTSANTYLIQNMYKMKIKTKMEDGLNYFIEWYKSYFNLKI